MAAVFDDEEVAARLVERESEEGRDRKVRFGMEEWTYERELLVGITEALMSLRAVLIGVNSPKGKVPKVDPLPRPTTALDRIRERRRREQMSELVAQLTPGHDFNG